MADEQNHTPEPEIKPTSPWRQKLEAQGVSFNFPEGQPLVGVLVRRDGKTGLPIEDDPIRKNIASGLSDAIRNGQKWAFAYVDVDNLKKANDNVERPFGDMVIVYGAAKTAQAVESSNLSKDTSVSITRPTDAADETNVWVFNLSDEEQQRMQENIKAAEEPLELQDPPFSLSLSSAVITSDDPRIQNELNKAKLWLLQDDDRIAFDFYEEVKNIANKDTILLKTAKDLKRIPHEQMLTAQGVQEIISVLTQEFGNSRISEEALELILKLMSAQAARVVVMSVKNQTAYQHLLEELGVSKEQIENNGSPEKLVDLFKSFFGSEEV